MSKEQRAITLALQALVDSTKHTAIEEFLQSVSKLIQGCFRETEALVTKCSESNSARENVLENTIERCPLFGREAIVGKVHFRSRPKCRGPGRNLSGFCGCIAAANSSALLVYEK